MREGIVVRGWRALTERRRRGAETSVVETLVHHPLWRLGVLFLGPALGILAFVLVSEVPDDRLPQAGKVMLAILVHTAAYWATGVIPPFATALLAMGLMVFLLGIPAEQGLPLGRNDLVHITGWEQFVSPASAPIIVLMLGGFVLGEAANKHGIDRVLASILLRPFGTRPAMVLLGVMLVTGFFSMWMSNTATAAMMMTLVVPIVISLEPESPLRRAIVLAVPIAANIGGMGTPIGTPPNAIAFAALRTAGGEMSFLQWTLFAVPVVVVLLAFAWAYLIVVYRPGKARIELGLTGPRQRLTWKTWTVMITMLVTVALWVAGEWIGISVGAAAIIPIVVFTATRLIDRDDFNRLEWNILILMAGGIALGAGIESTGLDRWLVGLISLDGLGPNKVAVVLAAAALLMATFMSHTATTNLLTPLAIGIAAGSGAIGVAPAAISVALGSSLAMALPVSTPPNAIAYATGEVRTPDMLKSGIAIGLFGLAVIALLAVVYF